MAFVLPRVAPRQGENHNCGQNELSFLYDHITPLRKYDVLLGSSVIDYDRPVRQFLSLHCIGGD